MSKKYYANVIDLFAISEAIIKLVMCDWFDKYDIVIGKETIDDVYIRLVGKNEEQIIARAELLKSNKEARNGGGVRIKVKNR